MDARKGAIIQEYAKKIERVVVGDSISNPGSQL